MQIRGGKWAWSAVAGMLLAFLAPQAAVASGCGSWCSATSHTRADSYYPAHSAPGMDALHYGLDLTWLPGTSRLVGEETVRLRAARTAKTLRLALAAAMRVRAVRLDGRVVPVRHEGSTLVVDHAVAHGSLHTLRLRYAGTVPRAVPFRFQRDALGMFHTRDHDVFTNDEPTGAYRWYAVNDQPADKAFYDFTLTTPAPRVGVANGRLVSRHRHGRMVTTRFHLDRPAASYLTTVEFGRYRHTRLRALAGTPLDIWTPKGDTWARRRARALRPALRWVERRLGHYPFATLSLIVVRGYNSGMENQTLITLGDGSYDTEFDTIVHEVAHQWYGDEVTPNDWRDVWMNEGMAMYLQEVWLAQHHHIGVGRQLDSVAAMEASSRAAFGPPAKYHRWAFAMDNVYYGPALMWDQLRERVGDRSFWSMVRSWPRSHRYVAVGRQAYLSWIEHRLHRDLQGFFRAWLLGTRTPPRT